MKNKFFKHSSELFLGWGLILVFSILFLIFGLVLIISDKSNYVLLIVGITFLVISLLYLAFCKRILTVIIFTENNIILTRFNKRISIISWEELVDIERTSYGWTWFLTFVTEKTKINVTLTKKMYNTIMMLCPYENIKNKINTFEYFKYFQKKK